VFARNSPNSPRSTRADAAQLARLIQSDPALTGEIMRAANSPVLRPRTPLVSLHRPVSWLGVAEVRNITMAVMLRGEVFTAPGHESESEELWREAWLAGLWGQGNCPRAPQARGERIPGGADAIAHGAALALKILRDSKRKQRAVMDAKAVARPGERI